MNALDAYRLGRRVRDRAFTAAARRAFAGLGAGSVLALPIRLEGEARIRIGDGVFVGDGSWLQTLGDGTIAIGDGCQFSGLAVVSAAVGIDIEDDVLMARNVHVLDHLHRFDLPGIPVHAQGIDGAAPVRVCRGAWIGANAVILPGVTIGRGAVVGANSVVRDDVADHAVAVGAPARTIRRISPLAPAPPAGATAAGADPARAAGGR